MKKKIILYIITLSMLFSVAGLNYLDSSKDISVIRQINYPMSAQQSYTVQKQKESKKAKNGQFLKGLWVSYMELDMSGTDRSFEAFKTKFDTIVSDAENFGFNTLIAQVRPFCDALYKSDYFPSSHILSGEQGKDCKYDALEYMCKACHDRGLNIQAWINPYRVCTNETPATLSEDNPYKKDTSIGTSTDNGIFLNPADKKAKQLIINGVKEIIKNYEVDGIQFDDYFYPTKDKSFDSEYYKSYQKSVKDKKLSLSQWRKNNVNELIRAVYKAVHSSDKEVVFGISPQGNIKNNAEIFADVKTWCSEKGYIDYICPQLYYSLDNPALAFEDAVSDWLKLKTNKELKIYSGLAGYKAGSDKDEGTWEDFDDILEKEYNITVESKYNGFMLYSYSSLSEKSAKAEISNLKKAVRQSKELYRNKL